MEAIELEKSLENQAKVQISPARPSERKPRFQIVKLEERIAPSMQSPATAPCSGKCMQK
jgi:hypothetical protein